MTDAVTISLISAAGSFAAALLGVFNNVLARRNEMHLEETKRAMVTLEKNTNSIKDALVASTEKEAHARGVLEQKMRGEEIASAVKDAKLTLPTEIERQEKDLGDK